MQALVNREEYGPQVALKIEVMGSIAVSVANRWMLGWPERSKALLEQEQYLPSLEAQVSLEKDVLAEAVAMSHLSDREILKIHEIAEAPPEVA